MQGFFGGFQRSSDELFICDLVDVSSCPPAYEVEVFAVALAAMAKTQCRAALEHDMPQDAGIGQRGQEMKMNDLLDEVLLHLPGDAMPRHEVGDGALEASGLAVHDFFLRKWLAPEFARRAD